MCHSPIPALLYAIRDCAGVALQVTTVYTLRNFPDLYQGLQEMVGVPNNATDGLGMDHLDRFMLAIDLGLYLDCNHA